jgi:serine/threonine protein kinase/Tol biopolymer transport system component
VALVPGSRVGVHEITAKIGAGGMGEVYRAIDTNLKRAVAIKVLPDAVAADRDRLARFQREAEALASLNHPNIAQIHGLERSDGTTALVMELVEGPTLADRIAQGPIPADEVLPIARQIADALEAAHEQGIIHRDLKPANLKVRADGTVKVLDFGLAKAMEPAGNAHDVSQSPTVTSPAMTAIGMILGTAAYMSPEQARGKTVDKRSDIWAFGCVLYEMLTGARAFPGVEVSDVLASVLAREPDWTQLPSTIPPALALYLRRCLHKDPKGRVRDIGDVRLALEGAFDAADPRTPPSSWGTRLPWVVAAAAVVGLIILAVVHLREVPPMDLQETRLEITTPPGRLSFFEISPDARKLVFSAAAEGQPLQLWLRSFDSEAAQPLAGTENAQFPFWSPDSRSIGFIASGKLMRTDLAGGRPRALADAAGPGGAWGPDGTILFTLTNTSPLYRVPAAGGPPVEMTHLRTPGEASHRFPDFLPDGRHFVFFVAGTANVQAVYVGSLDSKDTRRLLESESAAVFAPPHFVLFSRQENLLAQRLDLKTLQTSGDSFLVAERLSGDEGHLGEIAVSTSRAGLIAYRAPIIDPRQFSWFDRAGRKTSTLGDVNTSLMARSLRLSPDGRTVAVTRNINGNIDVWWMETARNVLRRFTSDPASDGAPVWAPDGSRIVFYSRRSGPQNLWLKRMDGGAEERLRESAENEVPTDWSADGRFILFGRLAGGTGIDLWALPLEGDRKPVAVANTAFDESSGRFSPDGRWVAYQSNETGRNEVYVVPFPASGVPTQLSTAGGMYPQWRDDGREIFYRGPGNRLTAVPVTLQPNGRLEAGKPTDLFTMSQGAFAYDITRDGQRVLVDTPVGQATTPPITIIQNWRPQP